MKKLVPLEQKHVDSRRLINSTCRGFSNYYPGALLILIAKQGNALNRFDN